jgi:hypothetical protein
MEAKCYADNIRIEINNCRRENTLAAQAIKEMELSYQQALEKMSKMEAAIT